jgi:hypothetical protein
MLNRHGANKFVFIIYLFCLALIGSTIAGTYQTQQIDDIAINK